jgi:hypothetical protein
VGKKHKPKEDPKISTAQARMWSLPLFCAVWYAFLLSKTYAGAGPAFASGFTPLLHGITLKAIALDSVLALALILAAHGWGSFSLRLLGAEDMTRSERRIHSVALGLGVLALLTLLLGMTFGLLRGLPLVLIGSGLTLTGLNLRRSLQQAAPAPQAPPLWQNGSWLEWILATLLAYTAALHLLGALAPETFYDSLVYHLGTPNIYLMRGRITAIDNLLHANFPANMQMLYLLGLAVRGATTAKLIHFATGVLSCWAIIELGRSMCSRRTGLAAAALFATVPVVAAAVWQSGVELGVTMWMLMGTWALLRGFHAEQPRYWLLLSGVHFGLAMGAKYTAVWGAAAAFFCLAIYLRRHPAKWQLLAQWSMAAVLLLSPWLVKNTLFTGNPVFPFLFRPSANLELDAFVHSAKGHFWSGGLTQWETWLVQPWRLFTQGRSAFSFIGPLLIIFAPVALTLRRAAFPFGWLLALFGLHYLFWMQSTSMVRLLVPALPLFCLFVTHRLNAFEPYKQIAPWAVLPIVLWNLAWGGSMLQQKDVPSVVSGKESATAYLKRRHHGYHHPYYDIAQASRDLPAQARIAFIGESRSFYFHRDVEVQSLFQPGLFLDTLKLATNPGQLHDLLEQRAITHLFVGHGEVARLIRPRLWRLADEKLLLLSRFFRGHVRLLQRNRAGAALYALQRPTGAIPAATQPREIPEIVRLALEGHPRYTPLSKTDRARFLLKLAD